MKKNVRDPLCLSEGSGETSKRACDQTRKPKTSHTQISSVTVSAINELRPMLRYYPPNDNELQVLSKPDRTTRTEASIMDTCAARPALYSTRTVLRFSSIVARRGTQWVAYRTYVLTVLYCCAHLLNYTVPVPYRTVRYIGPSSSACTTVLHSYRTLLQTLFSVLVGL